MSAPLTAQDMMAQEQNLVQEQNLAHAPLAPPVRIEDRGPVRILTLARPERRNSLSRAMMAGLRAALTETGGNRHIRAIVLAAEGPAFCAGHDLKEVTAARAEADGGRRSFEALMRQCVDLMLAIHALPLPVIAAVEGVATAAGCQLVASCDLAYAGAAATFATPGVHIGLFCSTPMVALARNVAPKHALEMLLTGASIDAETAFRFGLVNALAPKGEALTAAMAAAETIAAKSPAIVRIGKEAFYRQSALDRPAAYDDAARVMVENLLHADAREGIGAFVEKRTPVWGG